MRKCKICGLPLEGFRAKIRKLFFKQTSSKEDPNICNQCKEKMPKAEKKVDKPRFDKNKEKKYKCPVCKRMIHQSHALEHIKSEEYLLKLISKDHPNWDQKNPVCKECVEYYRRLIRNGEL